MLKAIAIDDEPMALEVIKAHAKKVTFLDLQETFVSAMEALDFLKKNPTDLVFLDINMPDITGLDSRNFYHKIHRLSSQRPILNTQ